MAACVLLEESAGFLHCMSRCGQPISQFLGVHPYLRRFTPTSNCAGSPVLFHGLAPCPPSCLLSCFCISSCSSLSFPPASVLGGQSAPGSRSSHQGPVLLSPGWQACSCPVRSSSLPLKLCHALKCPLTLPRDGHLSPAGQGEMD